MFKYYNSFKFLTVPTKWFLNYIMIYKQFMAIIYVKIKKNDHKIVYNSYRRDVYNTIL